VGLWLQKDLVEFIQTPSNSTSKDISHRFSNVVPKGYRKISLTKDQIKSYRWLFPTERRGSAAIVKKKLERFITQHEVDFETILDITRAYVEETTFKRGTTYVKSANNIAYKRVQGGEESLLENLLETRKNQVDTSKPAPKIDLDDYENLD